MIFEFGTDEEITTNKHEKSKTSRFNTIGSNSNKKHEKIDCIKKNVIDNKPFKRKVL